jgi:hypothetical protein
MNMLLSLLGFGCLGIFLLAFGGAGIFMIYSSRKSSAQAQASKNWPAVAGAVTLSEVGHGTSTDSDGDTHDSYHPRVEYTYQVGEQTLAGKQIAFGVVKVSSNPRGAEAVIAKYPLGAPVTVYINPSNPAEAVLERQASSATTLLVMGIIFLAVTVCLGLPGILGVAYGLVDRLTGN